MATATKSDTTTFVIQSQPLYDYNSIGGRFSGGQVYRGHYESWKNHKDNARNFREAVLRCRQRCIQKRIGAIIITRAYYNGMPTKTITKLAQIKWGHDDKLFVQFEGSIGNWWKRAAKITD